MNEPVGDRGRRLVVADDDGRRALLAGELGDQAVDGVGVLGVQLAGGLVCEQQVRPVRERGAERDPLLLAAGEARGPVVEPVAQADPLQQPRRRGARFRAAGTVELEPEAYRLRAGEVGRESARVVLVEDAEIPGAEAGERARREPADVLAEDARAPGGERVEAGDHAQQRRLPGAARPEHDDDLSLFHP